MLVIELVSSEPPCPTAPCDPQAGAQQTTISLFPTNCQWVLTVDVPEGCTTRRRRQKRPAPFTRPTVLSHTPNTSLIAPPQKDQHTGWRPLLRSLSSVGAGGGAGDTCSKPRLPRGQRSLLRGLRPGLLQTSRFQESSSIQRELFPYYPSCTSGFPFFLFI